jgi:hypothetical protein
MTTTLVQVARCLEQKDLKHTVDEENRNVWVGFQTENVECFQIAINVSEEGEYLQFVVKVLGDITEQQAPVIHKALLHISLQTKMVRWAYDPCDKEVWATVELLLMDNPLTEQVLYAHLEALVTIVDEIALPRLSRILTAGIDPYDLELGERLLLDLEATYPGALPSIEQAMTRRKQLADSTAVEKSSAATTSVWQKLWNVVAAGK